MKQRKSRGRHRLRAKQAGLPPGTLVHVGEVRHESAEVSIFEYDAEGCNERGRCSIGECIEMAGRRDVTWINVDGLHETDIVQTLGSHFGIHPLVQEDIVHTAQRPKLEDAGKHIYIVLHMLTSKGIEEPIESEQLSLILGPYYLLTFQEAAGDDFAPIRERIRKNQGTVRTAGPDYLAYRLVDTVVDQYFVVAESIGERIEALEDEITERPNPQTLHRLHTLKRECLKVRKAVWPLREVLSSLTRGESKLIAPATQVYFRDTYDHTIQLIDAIETYRDILSGLLDLYLSSQSNRMNEIMKILTIITTIFIPLSFVAGVYGMNFDNMPELHWRSGYFLVLAGMFLIALVMLAWFRRKRWL